VKTFIKHTANVKVYNITVGFIFQCQIINRNKTTMFNFFVPDDAELQTTEESRF
jgi:hypothetical protein